MTGGGARQFADAETRPMPASRLWPLALLLLGLALFATNPAFTLVDDEVNVFVFATEAAAPFLHSYWIGEAPHPHPPLYDLILHGWLRVTKGDLRLLRVPSILFYVLGLWFLALAAAKLAGPESLGSTLLVGLFWPYGFHFGRLAVWYSCSFFLVAWVTYAYLQLLDRPTWARWARWTVAALALVYSNYFGWAILACLGFDFFLERRKDFFRHWRAVAATLFLLAMAYLPLWRSLAGIASSRVSLPRSSADTLYAGFAGYVLFVSESVAPWFWWLSVPALVGITSCLAIVALREGAGARRFFLYFLFLFGAMTLLGILTTKRVMLIAPWLLLPLGAAPVALEAKSIRRLLLGSLALVFAIGWFGIFARRYYAAPRFFEPWPVVAREAARSVEQGALVIGNHPVFFFYLTAALENPAAAASPRMTGVLTYSASHPSVFQPQQWEEAGQPLRTHVLLVQGVPFLPTTGRMEKAATWIGERCQLEELRRSLADPGSGWKQRFLPQLGQSPWRIEVRTYSCPNHTTTPGR